MDLPGTGIQASSFRSTFDSYFRIVKGEDSDRESLLWKGPVQRVHCIEEPSSLIPRATPVGIAACQSSFLCRARKPARYCGASCCRRRNTDHYTDVELFMKKFVAIYIGTASAIEKWKAMDEAKRKEREQSGMKAWGDWMTANKAAVVDQGGPLGKTKRTSAQGVSDIKNSMTGYVIVQAESHEAAARMFEKHPHFTIFPGDSVEIMECLPIPGQ